MPLSSWFPIYKARPEADNRGAGKVAESPETPSADDFLNFETIADKVEALQEELAYAYHLCEQANLQFDKYRLDIHDLNEYVAALEKANENLQHQLAAEKERTVKYRAQIHQDQVTIKGQKALVTQLQARLDTETASLHAMTKHARSLEQRMIDTQFDLEYLKCTTSAEQQPVSASQNQSQDAPLPAQPFVVVLVDGDAYKVGVSQSIGMAWFTKTSVNSGTLSCF